MMSRISLVLVSVTVALSTSPAWAVQIQVPEPGMFGIVAAGAVAIFAAARLRNK